MAVTDEEIAFVHDLFSGVHAFTYRKMMGGLSLYSDGQIFAILSSSGRVYLKAIGEFAKTLADEGSEKFAMEDGRGMHYWTLPEAALDDPELASDWAKRTLDAL